MNGTAPPWETALHALELLERSVRDQDPDQRDRQLDDIAAARAWVRFLWRSSE